MSKKIKIGETDLEVARLNLGGNVFGWTIDEQQSFKILDAFTDHGFNFVDTADVYSVWAPGHKGGESETILGKWMKVRNNRKDIVLATKVGWDFGDGRKGLSKKYIKQAAEDSLKRLQTDYIDLYYTHKDEGDTAVEETLSAYQELISEGKVKYIAASNVPADRLIESLELANDKGYPRYQALQPHYNLVERQGYEKDYAPIAAEYNLTVFPYWALASGFLSGKYRSKADLGKSVRGSGAEKYLNDHGLGVLQAMDTIASKHNTTVASIALAWLLAKPNIGAPIASATSVEQLESLVAATKIELDESDIQLLDRKSQPAELVNE